MLEKRASVQEINDFIQRRMIELRLKNISPVEVTKWLVEAGMRERIESRPGSYLRSLCRKGKIKGAKQTNKSWLIHRK